MLAGRSTSRLSGPGCYFASIRRTGGGAGGGAADGAGGLGNRAGGRAGADGQLHTIVKLPWVPSLGSSFIWRRDGISLTLVVLTGLAAVSGISFPWNIEHRVKEFFAFYLAMIGGRVRGVSELRRVSFVRVL